MMKYIMSGICLLVVTGCTIVDYWQHRDDWDAEIQAKEQTLTTLQEEQHQEKERISDLERTVNRKMLEFERQQQNIQIVEAESQIIHQNIELLKLQISQKIQEKQAIEEHIQQLKDETTALHSTRKVLIQKKEEQKQKLLQELEELIDILTSVINCVFTSP